MDTTNLVAGSSIPTDPKELDALTRSSVKAFRALTPTLNAYARALTGNKKLRVIMTPHSNASTDGDKIYMRPPLDLGRKYDHVKTLCDKRERTTLRLLCDACRQREDVLIRIYHEIAHNAYGSFDKPSPGDLARILDRIVGTHKSAEAIKARVDQVSRWDKFNFVVLSNAVSSYFAFLLNAVEDMRVNIMMFEARPGTLPMLQAARIEVLTRGVEQLDENGQPIVMQWRDYPLDAQLALAISCPILGVSTDYFAEPVREAMKDKTLLQLANRIGELRSIAGAVDHTFEILVRGRELGFWLEPEEQPQPQPEPEPQPEDAEPEDGDDEPEDGASDDETTDDEQDDEPDGSGPENATDDADDSAESEDESADQPVGGQDSDGDDNEEDDSTETTGDTGESNEDSEPEEDAGDPGDSATDGEGEDDEHEASEGDPDESSDSEGDDDGLSDEDGASDEDSGSGDGESGDDGEPDESGGSDSDDGPSSSELGDGSGDNPGDSRGDGSETDRAHDGDDSSDRGSGSGADVPGDSGGDGSGLGSDSDHDSGDPAQDVPGTGDRRPAGDDPGADGTIESDPDGELTDDDASEEDAESGSEDGAESESSPSDSGREGEGQPGDLSEGESSGDDAPGQDGVDAEGDADGPESSAAGSSDGSSDPESYAESFRGNEGSEGQFADGTADLPTESAETEADTPAHGTVEDAKRAFGQFADHDEHGHEHDADGGHYEGVIGGSAAENMMAVAIMQDENFDKPSANVGGVVMFKYEDGRWNGQALGLQVGGKVGRADPVETEDGDLKTAESIMGPALLRLRKAFADNARGGVERNRRAGKLERNKLGRRAWQNDGRLFTKATKVERKDYVVLIGVDMSGSNFWGNRMHLSKRAAFAQIELCNRLGIPFVVYAHTGVYSGAFNGPNMAEEAMDLAIFEVKRLDQPWDSAARKRFEEIGPYSANLDGHTLEFYRKRLDEIITKKTTRGIIMYYTDGAMPMENYDEELVILQEEIETCRRRGYTLIGVGVKTDSPTEHGLDTVQVDGDEDVMKVVAKLEEHILR